MKTCNTCGQVKDKSLFYKRNNRVSGLAHQCKSCEQARRKLYRLENKEKIRADNKRRNPGWDIDRYNEYLELQNNTCAICKINTPGLSDWSTDHCHTTNQPRGLLCVRCNAGLGYFKDNPEYLQSAIDYLKKWQ
jgi:hypothetical protein